MKKIIVILMIVLFLASCSDDVISATSNIDWTQISNPFEGSNSVEIVYSILNTGKVSILGYSIVFEIQYEGGTASYGTKDNRPILPEEISSSPSLKPASAGEEFKEPLLPGEIFVETTSQSLTEGIVIQDVKITKLHIWSEKEERIYEY
jgi:hypothetical protein